MIYAADFLKVSYAFMPCLRIDRDLSYRHLANVIIGTYLPRLVPSKFSSRKNCLIPGLRHTQPSTTFIARFSTPSSKPDVVIVILSESRQRLPLRSLT